MGAKMVSDEYVMEMRNIEKEYFGNKVLSKINLKIRAGEILAIVGENGAGKSTLMNILFGMPIIHSSGGYKGQILIEGKEVSISSPKEAMEFGIGMVHQEFMLIPSFSVTENIKLNREITKHNIVSKIFGNNFKTLDKYQMGKDARRDLDKLGININEWIKVEELSVGYMQFVEIAREIDKENVKLIVFDEPTAVLTEKEAQNLLNSIKIISESGIAVIFISHKLDEVIQIANNIIVMRDGEIVAYKEKCSTNITELAKLMVGRSDIKVTGQNNLLKNNEDTIMVINNLKVYMPGEEVKGINLEIKKGEILGLGGLAGQGKIGIANGIMGLYPAEGEIYYKKQKLNLNSASTALEKGIAFVSEDRRRVGLLGDESIEMNIAITSIQVQKKFLKKYIMFSQIDDIGIREHANRMIKEFSIKCQGPQQAVKTLSGGNQQKVCIARALTMEPDLIFISEPTRGIDIGAKKIVLDYLLKLNKEKGMTIVIASSELKELRSVCDRIAIVSNGRIEGILKPDDSDEDFGLMMIGQYRKSSEQYNRTEEGKI